MKIIENASIVVKHMGNDSINVAILAAKVPMVLESRADNHVTKLFSVALGRVISTGLIEGNQSLKNNL